MSSLRAEGLYKSFKLRQVVQGISFGLESGDRLRIRRCPDVARILAVSTLRCMDCRYAHAPRRRY